MFRWQRGLPDAAAGDRLSCRILPYPHSITVEAPGAGDPRRPAGAVEILGAGDRGRHVEERSPRPPVRGPATPAPNDASAAAEVGRAVRRGLRLGAEVDGRQDAGDGAAGHMWSSGPSEVNRGTAIPASAPRARRTRAGDPGQQVGDEGFGELLGQRLVGDEEPVVAGAPELVDDHFRVDAGP